MVALEAGIAMTHVRRSGAVFAGLLVLGLVFGPVIEAQADSSVRMQDDCEPASFNAVLGPGACIGDGETTFNALINEVQNTGSAHRWRFKDSSSDVQQGDSVRVRNDGGEFHTATIVAHFGGGFVAELNELSGRNDPAPECATVADDGSLVPVGPNARSMFVDAQHRTSMSTGSLPPRTYLMQCCVHPWMHTQLVVERKH